MAEPHHEAVRLELDWYVNGTLDAEDAARVEAHLAGCDECRGDVALLRRVQAVTRASAAAAPEPRADFRGLARRVEAYEAGRRATGVGWRRWLPVAAGLLLVLQSVALVGWWTLGTPGYRALSAPGAVPVGDGLRVHVVFHDTATEAALRALLTAVEGRIVDGPSALGAYTVEVPRTPGRSLDDVVQRLRAADDVVRFAAPAAP